MIIIGGRCAEKVCNKSVRESRDNEVSFQNWGFSCSQSSSLNWVINLKKVNIDGMFRLLSGDST